MRAGTTLNILSGSGSKVKFVAVKNIKKDKQKQNKLLPVQKDF
jgi:hypothetical protein